jgi:hypothetical protein
MRDYLRGTDLAHIPEELYSLYEDQPQAIGRLEPQAAPQQQAVSR